MSPLASSAGRLLGTALALAVVLFLFGELRWGSGALIGFSGLWVYHFIREVGRVRRATGGRRKPEM